MKGVVQRDEEEIEGGDAEQRCQESRPPPIAIATTTTTASRNSIATSMICR